MPEFDPSQHPSRLNLGCGFDHRPGYLNVDFIDTHTPDLVADVRNLSMLPDDHYCEVLAQDVLEHLPRQSTLSTLREWNRVMTLGAELELRVPSILGIADLLQDEAYASPKGQEHMVQCLFGTQAYTGDIHLTGFTEPLLRYYLDRAAFSVTSWDLRDRWLFVVRAAKVAHEGGQADGRNLDLMNIESDAAFVAAVYARVLGREPDAGGLEFFETQLTTGAMDRLQMLSAVEASEEAQAQARS